VRHLSQIPTTRMRPRPPRRDKTGLPWLGFLALVLLQMADLVTTQLVLRAGGHEWNPIMALALARAGYAGLVVAKSASVGVAIAVIDGLYRVQPQRSLRGVPRLVMLGACGWLWLVCCFNTHMLLASLDH
jgi:Domain of unknown function (DUF5658)